MIKICKNCGNITSYDSYFKEQFCRYCGNSELNDRGTTMRLTEYDIIGGIKVGDLKVGIDPLIAYDKLAKYEDAEESEITITDNTKKYCWNFDEWSESWTNDIFDTVEECIVDAQQQIINNKMDIIDIPSFIYIGEVIDFIPCIDVESMLDQINENAGDECGDYGYNWEAYDHKKKNELDELTDKLNVVLHKWMKKYAYYPNFYKIENIKRYDFTIDK